MSEIIIKIKAPAKGAKDSIGGLANDVDRSFGGMEKSGTRLERSWRSLRNSWLKTAAVIGGSLIALKKGWDAAFNSARFSSTRGLGSCLKVPSCSKLIGIISIVP